jgi:S1-C subfamily serine protease
VPWIIGGLVTVVVVLAGALTLTRLIRQKGMSKTTGPAAIATGTTHQTARPLPHPAPALPAAPPNRPAEPPINPTEPPISPAEAMERVRRATVFIKAMRGNGGTSSGSGFLGVPDTPKLVLTNAHVVGMSSAASRAPHSVEVILHRGRAGERALPARVLDVDRSSGLAVLDLGEADSLPRPPHVRPAAGLRERTELTVMGFPAGDGPAREVALRRTSVLASHTNNGVLDRLQVDGGIDSGNSGGPVVDPDGHVIGVADAGRTGRPQAVVVPGERVRSILDGCFAEMILREPFAAPGPRVGVPVVLVMTDPRRCIRSVALDVWVGNRPPAGRPASLFAPPWPQPGSPSLVHQQLEYKDGRAQGEVVLPPLTGQTYWLQPTWIDGSGQTQRAPASPFIPSPPMTR